MTSAQRKLQRRIKRQGAEVARLKQLHADAKFCLRLMRARLKRLDEPADADLVFKAAAGYLAKGGGS